MPLGEFHKPTAFVPPEGPRNAKLGLVGEAPGAVEIRRGKPFVGPAGELLDRLLLAVRLVRSELYVTNVVKERPPTTTRTNDISEFIDLSKKHPIETPQYQQYLSELREELEATDVNLFVAFGNVPLYALTGIHPPKVTKRRGSIYPCTLVPGRKVMACIHPAACLHRGRTGGMYLFQHYIRHDLMRAREDCRERELKKPKYDLLLNPRFEEVENFMLSASKAEVLAFDIEVVNLEVSCISVARYIEDNYIQSMSIPFTEQSRDYFTVDQEAEVWRMLAYPLEDDNVLKVGQNLAFDTQFLFRKYGINTVNIEDTMIAQGILAPDLPKGLDFITSIYTRQPYYKDEGKKYIRIGGPDEDFWKYNALDSAVCLDALPQQLAELDEMGNRETYDAQKSLVPILVCMSERGFRMDVEGLRAESARVGSRIEELHEKLNRMCGTEINPNSPKQLAEYFYETKGYRPYKKRSTGAVTTDEDALKRLSRKGAPEASILLEIRRLSKLKGTYLDVELDGDGRLRCSFNPVGAADSGRLSSSKTIWGTGMNMQNDPPEFKKFMIPDEGYALYDLDLEQAENRFVAYFAPEWRMMKAFEDGVDVHSLTASLIFDIPVDEVIGMNREDVTCSIGQGVYTHRFWGKKANHGLNYGLGFKTFAFYYEIPERDSRLIVNKYHQAYPGVRKYHAWIQEALRRNRRLQNPYGRIRRFMDRWGDSLFKEAYSWLPQSSTADKINREGLIHVYYDMQADYKYVELLNQVHDSLVIQMPLSVGWRAHADALLAVRKSLESPVAWKDREFVIPVGLSIGKNMKDMKEVKWNSADKLAEELQRQWEGNERKVSQ